MDINEDKAENTPAGGVLVGKKDGQTIIHDKGTMSGYLVGKLHKDGGIKAVNKATGQPLEMQGGEVIITAPAVSDQTKREFEGKMMTNREILSAINEKGGGVSFADGGDIPAKIHTNDCEYKLGGKVVKDTDIAHSLGMNSTLKKGKQQFSSGDTTYDVDAIYNAIKKGKLRLKTKEVETFPMKYPVYDKKYSETVKTDFRKPNGITVRTESGEEVLIDGNHRMNNAYLKGKKTMKTYYIEDPKQIAKFTKKNKFELGGENKMGGHLSSGKSLKQIAEMHNVSLAHINEELAKGLEVEKEHFTDFKERTRVAKDHLVENPNYYTILEKAGLKNGGHIQRQELIEKSKKGDTPARDLNNYNDVMDLQADEAVGGESGLAFANGGKIDEWFEKPHNLRSVYNKNPFEVTVNDFDCAEKIKNKHKQVEIIKLVNPRVKVPITYVLVIKNWSSVEELKDMLIECGGNMSSYGFTSNEQIEAYKRMSFANGGQVSNFFKKTYGNLVEKQGIITTKTDWFNKDGVKVLEYGFDPYRYEKGNTLFFYSWDYDDSGMDYDDFKEQLVDFFKKTYKKDVSELKALYVGWDRKEKDTYADGGITPIDANIEGDSVDIVESDFAKGGAVYDTTKPKLEKVTIKESKYGRESIVGRNASNVKELQDIIIDYVRNSTDEVDWIKFYVNDATRGSYYIDLNKGKKNTVKNVNTETVNAQNIKRVIDAKDYLVKNYDWTDFFEGASKGMGVDPNVIAQLQSLGVNVNQLLAPKTKIPVILNNSVQQLVKTPTGQEIPVIVLPVNKDFDGKYSQQIYIRDWRGSDWLVNTFANIKEQICLTKVIAGKIENGIFEVSTNIPAITLIEEKVTKRYQRKIVFYQGLEALSKMKDIISKDLPIPNLAQPQTTPTSTFTGSTSTKTPLTKEELYNSRIWIGDNVELRDKVIAKLEEIGIPFDKYSGNAVADESIDINIFSNDFVVYKESKEEFDKDTKRKEIFLEDLGIDVTTMGVAPTTANALTSAKPFDFSMTKIDVMDNVDLSIRVQQKAFKDGWEWENGGGKNTKNDPFNYMYFTKTSISFGNTTSSFDNSPKREITEAEIFGTQATTSIKKPKVEKLYVLNGASFSDIEKIRLYLDTTNVGQDEIYFYINRNGTSDFIRVEMKDSLSSMYYNRNAGLEPKYEKLREIFELNRAFENYDWEEFFSNVVSSSTANSSTSASSQVNATVKIPVVYQIKIYTTEKNSGTPSVSVARSFEDFFRIIKKLVVTKDEFVDTINLSIFSDDPNIKYSYLSFALEEQTFDLLTDIEAKENLMDSLSANNQELDFKEFFSKSQDKNVDYVIVKEPRSFPDGQKVYRGSGLLPLLKEIYKNSLTDRTKVDIDLVVNGEAENDPITLTLTGVSTYSDYEINPNDINEQILYGKLKLDWLPEYQWDRLFPLIELLDFYLEDSYLPNYTTKNINELFSKLNAPEVKSSNKEITLTWFGENGETHKFGAYFTNDATVYYQIDRDNFTLDFLRGKLDDWFYGRLSESYMFPDGQVKAKTPTSNSAVPKIVEQGVYNLDLAVSKLEKASSVVVTEYNKEIYDKTLKFLYDTKATYELALKFTPESAFMYERLDILKKLADIEKKIKNIEDMKKGGTFYMLAKILEKLERGENWKMLEQSQDVITNQIPQSEIDVIIRSQKFKNWFGDWEKALINDEYDNVSKALTEGIPTVYHHGARRIKYTYREVSNGVLYLAENISYAVWFSQNATAQSEEGNYLTECFVNIKNPIDLTAFHVKKVDLGDIVRYVDAVYPLAKIYDFIPAQVALLIKTNQPTNVRMWAWQLIRSYAKFVNHIKENTPYDGFLYYENNPSDEVINPATGQLEENVTKAVAIFKSHQVKVVDAVLFDGGLDDWRFENGGKIKN